MIYAVQIFVTVLLSLGIPAAFEIGLGWSEITGSPFGKNGIQIVRPIILMIAGWLTGFLVVRFWSRASKHGGLVFLPFTILFALGIIYDFVLFHRFDVIWEEFFYWSHPGGEEPSLLVYIVTYPMITSLAYSLGIRNGVGRWKE